MSALQEVRDDKAIIQEFNRGGEDILFVELLRKAGLDDHMVAAVIEAVGWTCEKCRDQWIPCQCGNDE